MKISSEPQKNAFVSENSVKNIDRAGRDSAAMGKPAAVSARPVLPAGSSNLPDLISSLKLPQDNLSRSIIAFARFFLIPLESKYLNLLRKEALNLTGKNAPHQEAAALAKTAASDKGLKLDKKALTEYASAIEASIKSFTGKNTEGTHADRQVKEKEDGYKGDKGDSRGNDEANEHNDLGGGSFQNNAGQEKQQKKPPEQFSGEIIRQQMTETLKDRPMLDLINRIPGKKGRWIVVPFSFNQKEFEFNVSLRILLYSESNGKFLDREAVTERLTADITVKRIKGTEAKREWQRRWFISLERPKPVLEVCSDETFVTDSRVRVYSETAERSPGNKKKFRKELAKALGLPLERIEITEKPVLFADCREDHLRTVDEEV